MNVKPRSSIDHHERNTVYIRSHHNLFLVGIWNEDMAFQIVGKLRICQHTNKRQRIIIYCKIHQGHKHYQNKHRVIEKTRKKETQT